MEEQGEDFLLLETAFRYLLNLSHVSIDNTKRIGLLDVLDNANYYGLIQKPVDNCGSHLLELLLRPFRYGCGTNNMNFPAMFRKLPPHTISLAVQNLRSLKLKNVYYGDDEIFYHDAVREESSGYRWTCKANQDVEHGTTEAIAEMLSSAPLLEVLTLRFYKCRRAYDKPLLTPYMPLQSMRGSNKLQQLKRLSLAKLKTRQDQLVPFLLGAASIVTHIDMEGIVLESRSWLSVFLQLREKFPQLVRFSAGLDDLCEARLGAEGKCTENPKPIMKASDVQVSTIYHSLLFDFGDHVILG